MKCASVASVASVAILKLRMLSDEEFIKYTSKREFADGELEALEKFSNKEHGKILCCGYLPNASEKCIRIVITTLGFTLWIPQCLYNKYDVQVNQYVSIVDDETQSCWIADGSYGFVKINIDKKSLEGESKKYADDNLDIRTAKVIDFAKRNFVNNTQLYPDRIQNTIGYLKERPNEIPSSSLITKEKLSNQLSAINFRIRLGGDYSIKF